MRSTIRLLVAFLVLPGAVAATLYRMESHGFFDLDHIEITLEDAPAKAAFLKPLVDQLDRRLEAERGRSLWRLDAGKLSREIGNLNWVEGHSLARTWPRGLVVKIKPRPVKALYLTKENIFIPVIREGQMLDPVDPKLAPDVVILDGEAFRKREDLRRKAVSMMDEIPESGTFSRKTISEIRWSNKDGFMMRMVRTGLEVKIGDDHMALKAARVSQVIDYLNARNLSAQSLDANLSKKVLVKLQDGETLSSPANR